MAWHVNFATRDAFDQATTAPAGASQAQYDFARSLALQILDSGHVPTGTVNPEHEAEQRRVHEQRAKEEGRAPDPAFQPVPQATIRISLAGNEGDPASILVSVSQA